MDDKPAIAEREAWPQPGHHRVIVPAPVGTMGTGAPDMECKAMAEFGPDMVFMMGDNPVLPRMPKKPRLLDFFRFRMTGITLNHLFLSAKAALDAGHEEKIVLACLLHDIANGALIRSDHGYWGAQLIAPYVSEEIAWAVRNHQVLRYFADESVGYAYPEAYERYFGADYQPPEYVRQAYEEARQHKWYMTARIITLNDIYFFPKGEAIDLEIFSDIIGRHFKEPEEGLGFDGSPVAHMWRSIIWPNNFL
jgi:hypothetical protein